MFLMALLLGCTRYEFSIEPQATASPEPSVLPTGISASDLYVVVFAEARPPVGGSTINACASDFYASLARNIQKTISLAIVLQDGATKIPLYAVSQQSQNSCLTDYNGRFVFSPQTLSNLQQFTLKADTLYDVKSTEKVTKYIADAAALAGTMAPQGAPVIAAITTILNSNIANDIKQDVNDAFSQHYDTGIVLADLTQSTVLLNEQKFDMMAYPSNSSNQRNGDPAVKLGTLTVTTKRTPTLIGEVPGNNSPKYDKIQSNTTKITTVINSGGQTVAQSSLLFDLVNTAPVQAAGTVVSLGLASQPTAADVRKACNVLEAALANLQLNRLDTVAFLWRVYSDSPYATQHDLVNSSKSDCLSPSDFTLVKALGIQGWPQGSTAASLNHSLQYLAAVR